MCNSCHNIFSSMLLHNRIEVGGSQNPVQTLQKPFRWDHKLRSPLCIRMQKDHILCALKVLFIVRVRVWWIMETLNSPVCTKNQMNVCGFEECCKLEHSCMVCTERQQQSLTKAAFDACVAHSLVIVCWCSSAETLSFIQHWVRESHVQPFPHTCTSCHTYSCSVNCHSSSCAPASGISVMEFVTSQRLL